jgi:hypothetical protein
VYELVVLRARRRDNGCAERSRDLYGEVPETARADALEPERFGG